MTLSRSRTGEKRGKTDRHSKAPTTSQHSQYAAGTIALSQAETVLLSSSGDVLVCRCRSSVYSQMQAPYQWQEDVALLCCDAQCDDLSQHLQEGTILCSPWSRTTAKQGLLGGAPAEVASPLHRENGVRLHGRGGGLYGGYPSTRPLSPPKLSPTNSEQPCKESFQSWAQKAFQSPPLSDTGFDEESIVPIRSFDYSHFADGGNDMLPPPNTTTTTTPPSSTKKSKADETSAARSDRLPSEGKHLGEPALLHGVPTFFPSFSQVSITQVSAHPLGSHVLLISNAGLLYSYGLNDYGQLGIGIKSPARGSDRGYVGVPSIVTPLVENGGKAIMCAAGVNHSLVVVVTEERRLMKSRSTGQLEKSDDDDVPTEAIVHHQLYGFGRNDFMKIGLVSPKIAKPGSEDEMESVLLPRRVALRCKVRPEGHWRGDPSVAPPQGIFALQASAEHSAALVRRASGDVELYTWGNAMNGALGLPQTTRALGVGNFNGNNTSAAIRVVPVPSFVATLSRTSNVQARSSSVLLRGEFPTCISLGSRCSLVTTSEGRCFSFGISEEGMLGLGGCVRECPTPSELVLPPDARQEFIVSVRAGSSSVLATTRSGAVLGWGVKAYIGLDEGQVFGDEIETNYIQWSPKRIPLPDDGDTRIVEVAAGFDNAVFVTETGRVLSCGKASGRLGLGEVDQNVSSPQTMFGGLQLWLSKRRRSPAPTPPLPKRKLQRGQTVA